MLVSWHGIGGPKDPFLCCMINNSLYDVVDERSGNGKVIEDHGAV